MITDKDIIKLKITFITKNELQETEDRLISRMDVKFATKNDLQNAVGELIEYSNSLHQEVLHRFEAVDKKFETIDRKFEIIDNRLETIDNKLESIDNRLSKLDQILEIIQTNHSELIAHRYRLQSLEQQVFIPNK